MRPRTYCFITVFVGYAAFAIFALATPVEVTDGQMSTTEEQKVLLDCQHTDYRTYIKCLKRQKRHHFQHGDNSANFDPDCWELCSKKCETEHDCDKKCGHCVRKTKRKHQIITEYETECISGDCANRSNSDSNDLSKNINITTKIDIHNYLGNRSVPCCPTCKPPVPCTPTQIPPTPPPPRLPPSPPFPPCHPNIPQPPYSPIFPVVPQVPQVTLVTILGLGLIQGGGCQYPNQWPCPQPYAPPIDCSGCRPPYNHFKCDISCYSAQGSQFSNPGYPNVQTPCITPHCVGGTSESYNRN